MGAGENRAQGWLLARLQIFSLFLARGRLDLEREKGWGKTRFFCGAWLFLFLFFSFVCVCLMGMIPNYGGGVSASSSIGMFVGVMSRNVYCDSNGERQ